MKKDENCLTSRDIERVSFYENVNKGIPYHWRDIGPDEIWNTAWEKAIKSIEEGKRKFNL